MTTHGQGFRVAFEKFARLEISLADLQTATGRSWELEQAESGYALTAMPAIEPPVEFDENHVGLVLARFIDGQLSARAVEEWANLLIMSDAFDVSPRMSPTERDTVLSILHEVASPEVNGPLTRQRAQEMNLGLS